MNLLQNVKLKIFPHHYYLLRLLVLTFSARHHKPMVGRDGNNPDDWTNSNGGRAPQQYSPLSMISRQLWLHILLAYIGRWHRYDICLPLAVCTLYFPLFLVTVFFFFKYLKCFLMILHSRFISFNALNFRNSLSFLDTYISSQLFISVSFYLFSTLFSLCFLAQMIPRAR